MPPKLEYATARVRDLRAVGDKVAKNGLPIVDCMELKGEPLQPSPRFWKSFFGLFRISDTTFRYFSHREVFRRITQRADCERFQYCVERNKGQRKLLAVTRPGRPVVDCGAARKLIKRYDGDRIEYEDGIISSTHAPRSGDHVIKIGGDRFQNRFELRMPVDGYGLPRIHLSLLRLVCTNGAVGYSRAFRSDINLGKDPLHSITRALETYDNDSGYAALWQRFESAQTSWASLHETQTLYGLLVQLEGAHRLKKPGILKRFYEITGRPHELYGIANLDAFSVKRQRMLPAKCRVYDLLNFASEVATHQTASGDSLQLQAYIGSLVSDEYDMEGTAKKVGDFQDFFVRPSAN